jgi:peptide/nickel transport system substrate-binding protein
LEAKMMNDRSRRLLALLAAAVLLPAACGGGDGNGAEGQTTEAAGGSVERRFAELKIAFDDGIDYLDPGLSYTVEGWSIMLPVHLTPLTYKLENGPGGATLIPALAEDLPEVSADGKTYRFTLREGLTYSDGKPVKASDWKASIKRLYQIESPGSGFFMGIEGAQKFAETKEGDISGIVVDDAARSIEVRLVESRGDFLNVLAMMFSAVVPASTPAKDQSTVGIPATGPYMIERHVPNRRVTLVRNPQWNGIEGVPDGNPDKLTFDVFEEDAAALQTVIDNKHDYDFRTIPVDRLGEVQERYGERLRINPSPNTYYYFMNTRVKPFDDLRVRQAVNYAIDRQAIVKLFGGLASVTENVLPPTYPQYEKLNLYPHDLEKAKQLIRQAGAQRARVTVWGISGGGVVQRLSEYLVDVLDQIGLDARLKLVEGSIYWPTIGNQRTKAQTGMANWFQDYPHPLNWFDVLLNGNRITNEHNNNFSNADVPRINNLIEELKKEPELTDAVNDRWKEVDRLVMENALWAPTVNSQRTDFFSESMDLENCYVSHVVYAWIYSLGCKKQ